MRVSVFGEMKPPYRVPSIVHPTEKRKFSVGELKRLSSFPDDFVLSGSYEQQCERIGRAVPPLMAAAIATAIRDQVLIPAITAT